MQWIIDNKEWIFSGIGVFVLSVFLTIFAKKNNNRSINMKQKSGKNSTNIQIGRDYNGR